MPRRPLFALALTALLADCGTQTLVAGLFVNTPALPNPAQPGSMLGPYSVLLTFVASIDTSNPTDLSSASITGVTGATTQFIYESCIGAPDAGGCIASGQGGTDRVLSVPDQGSGLYELNSASPPAGQPPLTFEEGVTYTLIIQVPDGSDFDAYGARFQPGPPPHMVEFADKTQVKQISAGTSLTITRDDAPGADGRLLPAAVLVSQIDPQNPTGVPSIVWSSIQYNDPKTLALLALSDEPYRVGTFTVDGSAFVASGYYIVTLVSLAEGKASDNAFIGSTALAGSGDSGLVQVQ